MTTIFANMAICVISNIHYLKRKKQFHEKGRQIYIIKNYNSIQQ